MSEAEPDPSTPRGEARERYWRGKLRRLQFGVEPLGVQVDKYRRANLVLTIICVGVGLFFLAIFSAFRRPDLGLWIIAGFPTPIVAIAWVDWLVLKSRVAAYEAEGGDRG